MATIVSLQQQLTASQQQLAALKTQHTTLQTQNTTLQQQFNTLKTQHTTSQQQLTASQQQLTASQQQLTASQQQLTTLKAQQLITLKAQRTTLQTQQTTLQQQLTTLQQQHTTLQQQQATLQQEKVTLQTQSQSLKLQLDSLNVKYNKIQSEGVSKLAELLKTLTPPQVNLLHSLDNFRVDVFQSNHEAAQLNSSVQFMTSTVSNLKNGIVKVIQHQKDCQEKRIQAKNGVMQTLTAASISEVVMKAALAPLQVDIDEFGKTVDEWNAFLKAVSALYQ